MVNSRVLGRLLTLLFFLLFSVDLDAQKVKRVRIEYTFNAPDNISLTDAKRIALERAKLKAIAEEFGTVMQSTTTTLVGNKNGKSSIDISTINESEVRGVWIETIGEPKFSSPIFEQNMLTFTVRVEGRIREILSATINLKAKVLRNGTEDKYESDEFRNGDDLFLGFQAPKDGCLAVYLVDAARTAYCLLPYRTQSDGIYPIEANRQYVFFSSKYASASEKNIVDEYVMTTDRASEHNLIYIIYSPNTFTKAVDNGGTATLPRDLSFEDFQKWLVNCRKFDKDMQVVKRDIVIQK